MEFMVFAGHHDLHHRGRPEAHQGADSYCRMTRLSSRFGVAGTPQAFIVNPRYAKVTALFYRGANEICFLPRFFPDADRPHRFADGHAAPVRCLHRHGPGRQPLSGCRSRGRAPGDGAGAEQRSRLRSGRFTYHRSRPALGRFSGRCRRRGLGQGEPAKRGAVAGAIRSVGTDHDRMPHTGMMIYKDGVTKIPAAGVSTPDGDLIRRQVQSKQPVKLSLFMQNATHADMESFNVLAEMRGSEKPDQIVAIGGHLDSWDLGTGAIDDGAGVAITVATAKILRDVSAKQGVIQERTIRVVLFANEENGFDGAFAYTRTHGGDRQQLVAEADLGSDRVYRLDTGVNEASLPWLKELGPMLAPLGIEMGPNTGKASSDLGHIGGTHNLPAVSMHQDANRYFDLHHTANDTLDKVDPANLKQTVAAWTAMVWLATQASVDFKWAPVQKD